MSPTPGSALSAALSSWAEAVGSANVITDASSLRSAETATFATTQQIPAIVRPGGREEVQACLRIANRFRIPLYPISGGKNWGYGSRVPPRGDCALLDLGRMNRIADFSEDLAYVTVEPGVTQGQLFEFLKAKGSHLWIDATGASPDCSLIGNTLERGFGHTPYGDHFSHCCGLEVVLPNGECLQTGFARFPQSVAGPVSRWGVGPVLDGLFSQSNLGVVTCMTIWLMPAPEYFQSFYFSCDDASGLSPLIDALRELRLNGTLRSTVHVGNDYKVISGIQQYPWSETGGRTPLEGEVLDAMRKQYRISRWNGSGALYGTRGQVAAARRILRKAFAGRVKKLQFLDDRMLLLAERFSRPFRWLTGWDLTRTLELIRPVYGLMQGVPTSHALGSTYWRKRHTPGADLDPDRDRCGLLWCSPVAPASGDHAEKLTELTEKTVLRHGFEPLISISMVSDRALTCVVSITYDRDVAGEDQRAAACYQELLHNLLEHGYPSYRLSVASMQAGIGDDRALQFLNQLKQMADPNGILAPGRYLNT